jgi:hypothetical protein
MVSDYAEDSFIVVDCLRGVEIDYDSNIGSGLDGSFGFRKTKNIPGLVEKLEFGRQIRIIIDRKHSAHHLLQSS